ncbi:MAG: hypothetical protein BWY19_00195 [bacterium ADurb.Bin212]|nr:MAG: hypothetical protein BWY19_00195 [bacterium ADurb.Bin212]
MFPAPLACVTKEPFSVSPSMKIATVLLVATVILLNEKTPPLVVSTVVAVAPLMERAIVLSAPILVLLFSAV